MIIDDDFVDAVEQEVGMGCGAWDMEDPKDIIKAVIEVYQRDHLLNWEEIQCPH